MDGERVRVLVLEKEAESLREISSPSWRWSWPTGSGCYSSYYHVQADGTKGLNVQLVAVRGDDYGLPLPTSKSGCEASVLEAQFWGYLDPGQPGSGWNHLATKSGAGVWSAAKLRCEVLWLAHSQASSPYSRLRVMTRATVATIFGTISTKTTGRLDNLNW